MRQVQTHCYWKYGVWPRRAWITQLYGGLEGVTKASMLVLALAAFVAALAALVAVAVAVAVAGDVGRGVDDGGIDQ